MCLRITAKSRVRKYNTPTEMNSVTQKFLEGAQYINSILETEENCTTDNTRHVYYRLELYESQRLVSILKPNERFFKDDLKFKDDKYV